MQSSTLEVYITNAYEMKYKERKTKLKSLNTVTSLYVNLNICKYLLHYF